MFSRRLSLNPVTRRRRRSRVEHLFERDEALLVLPVRDGVEVDVLDRVSGNLLALNQLGVGANANRLGVELDLPLPLPVGDHEDLLAGDEVFPGDAPASRLVSETPHLVGVDESLLVRQRAVRAGDAVEDVDVH